MKCSSASEVLVGVMQIVQHDQRRMRAGPDFEEVGDRIEEAKARFARFELLAARWPWRRQRRPQIRNDRATWWMISEAISDSRARLLCRSGSSAPGKLRIN